MSTLRTPAATEPRRRLHPLSPLLRSAQILAALIAVISIQGFVRLGWYGGLGILLMAMVGVMAVTALSWLVTGYHVVGRELRIYDGVLVRRTRAIPLERLQAVEVVRPLLARLAGLAELRLEVVGGGKTEAPLAFLTVAEAAALRERLLTLATQVGAPAAAATPPAGAIVTTDTSAGPPEPPPAQPIQPVEPAAAAPTRSSTSAAAPAAPVERPLHRVVNREVLVSQLLTPQMLFLPFGVAMVASQAAYRTTWSLVVLLSMALAVVGVVQQPVRRILSDWNFRLALQEPPASAGAATPRTSPRAGLRVRHGLTETRSQTVPLHRIQAVRVTWPRLWRRRQWLRCRISVAGISAAEQSAASSDQLLPVGDLATARYLIDVVLPGVDLTGLRLASPPRRARWEAPLRQPILGVALTDRVFAVRDGRITREVTMVPYERIQSVRLVQGPLQRWLGLATVHVDTAGSSVVPAAHRDLAEARWLAGELTERARAARATT